jgi:hypothetical protein
MPNIFQALLGMPRGILFCFKSYPIGGLKGLCGTKEIQHAPRHRHHRYQAFGVLVIFHAKTDGSTKRRKEAHIVQPSDSTKRRNMFQLSHVPGHPAFGRSVEEEPDCDAYSLD